jgi:hypothetical protein
MTIEDIAFPKNYSLAVPLFPAHLASRELSSWLYLYAEEWPAQQHECFRLITVIFRSKAKLGPTGFRSFAVNSRWSS